MNAIAIRDERLIEMTLKATVIYDDFDFATRAAALLERVALRVHEAMKWDVKPWRLDVLKQSSLAEVAGAEAADADLIVFALSKTHSPPPELTVWLEDLGGTPANREPRRHGVDPGRTRRRNAALARTQTIRRATRAGLFEQP